MKSLEWAASASHASSMHWAADTAVLLWKCIIASISLWSLFWIATRPQKIRQSWQLQVHCKFGPDTDTNSYLPSFNALLCIHSGNVQVAIVYRQFSRLDYATMNLQCRPVKWHLLQAFSIQGISTILRAVTLGPLLPMSVLQLDIWSPANIHFCAWDTGWRRSTLSIGHVIQVCKAVRREARTLCEGYKIHALHFWYPKLSHEIKNWFEKYLKA